MAYRPIFTPCPQLYDDMEALCADRMRQLVTMVINGPLHVGSPIDEDLNVDMPEPSGPLESMEFRLIRLILDHIRNKKLTTVRKMFADIADNVDDREMLVDSAARLLGSVDDVYCGDVFKKVPFIFDHSDSNSFKYQVMIDDALTDIIMGFFTRKILNGTQALIAMLESIDFRKPIAMSKKKEKFLWDRIMEADYKGRKSAMTGLIQIIQNNERAPDLYCLQALRPIENMLIDLLDRKKHLVPAIVSISEIKNLGPKSLAYMFKRFADAIFDVQASFRPLAVIIELIGQTYMYPAITHPAFLSTNRWRLDGSGKIRTQIALPHSTEAQAPQTFLQYVLLKQPKLVMYEDDVNFQPLFMHTLRQVTEVICMLILEAMAAMEQPDVNMEDPVNQFNWQNISDVCANTLAHGSAQFKSLLEMLHAQLKELKYRKARGELMRVLLQYVGIMVFSSMRGNADYNFDFYKNLYDLYNLLYEEDTENFNTATGESIKVRFFAPAAIWLNLADRIEREQAAHPESAAQYLAPPKLVRCIEFIKDFLNGSKEIEEDFIAVIANSCTAQPDKFEQLFCSRILLQIETPIPNMQKWSLPYSWPSGCGTMALKMSLLESLSFTACQQLFKYLKIRLQVTLQQNETPCPALMESLARMTYVGDTKGNIKCLAHLFIGPKGNEFLAPYQLTLMSEFFSPRLKIISDTKIAPHMFIKAYDYMHHFINMRDSQSLLSYAALEAHFIRMFQWASPHCFRFYPPVVVKIAKPKFNLKSSPMEFFTGEVVVSPEVYGLFVMQYMRIHKMTSPSHFYASDWETADYAIIKHHAVPPAAKKWIPAKFRNMPVHQSPGEDWIKAVVEQTTADIDHFCGRNLNYFHAMFEKNDPRLFILLFRIIFEEVPLTRPMEFPIFAYQFLTQMTARYLIILTNALVDYIIWNLATIKQQDPDNRTRGAAHLVKSLNDFIFKHGFVPLDRFFFQLVTHPGDDVSVRLGLELVALFVEDNSNLDQRLSNLSNFLPSYFQMSYSHSHKYFLGMRQYYETFPELSYKELFHQRSLDNEHIPIYYTNLIERMLPAVDVLFQKLIEQEMDAAIFSALVKKFGFMYRYHPTPATFLYTTLFAMPPELVRVDTVREFVREVALNSDRDHLHKLNGIEKELRCAMLSECFLDRLEVATADEICRKLIDRVNRASTYKHQPPGFAAKDFRFAELPPAAATLTGANIELMVSKHSAGDIIDALYRCAFERPLEKPYDVLNAMALIVTTLPEHFQIYFVDKLEEFVVLPMLTKADDNPKALLESFSRDAFLASENQALSVLSVFHAYFQHCSYNGFTLLINKIKGLVSLIKTESQLIFMLRIIAPLIERCDMMDVTISCALCMYELIDNVLKEKKALILEDTVSDLLYYVKYTVIGYSNKEDVEEYVSRMPASMREKLKYLQMGGSDSEAQQKQTQEQAAAHRVLGHQPSQMQMAMMANLSRTSSQVPMNFPPGFNPQMHRMPMPQPGRGSVEAETVAPPIRVDMLPEYQPARISASEVGAPGHHPGGPHGGPMMPPHHPSGPGSNLAQSMPAMAAMLNQPPQNRPQFPPGFRGQMMGPPQGMHHHPGMMNPNFGHPSGGGNPMMQGGMPPGGGGMMQRFMPHGGYAGSPGPGQFGGMPPPGSHGSTPTSAAVGFPGPGPMGGPNSMGPPTSASVGFPGPGPSSSAGVGFPGPGPSSSASLGFPGPGPMGQPPSASVAGGFPGPGPMSNSGSAGVGFPGPGPMNPSSSAGVGFPGPGPMGQGHMGGIPNQGGLMQGGGIPPHMMGASGGNGFNFQPGTGQGPPMRPGMPPFGMPPGR
uniref:Mediator of RNA polymerase II transcription subunit 23 n=1 Tax=Panagrellus redivivus TaxID=6233 RepID=A0A7E4VNQ0_PANRE